MTAPPRVRRNRSMPDCSVIPVLGYPDVKAAAAWLIEAFGFVERLRIGTHRIQLRYGDGAVVLAAQATAGSGSIMLRVDDAEAHCARARIAGARILGEPTVFPYGEKQYSAADPFGYLWTFSECVADVDPADWGGELIDPAG